MVAYCLGLELARKWERRGGEGREVVGRKVAYERTQNTGSLVHFGTSGAQGLCVSAGGQKRKTRTRVWQC